MGKGPAGASGGWLARSQETPHGRQHLEVGHSKVTAGLEEAGRPAVDVLMRVLQGRLDGMLVAAVDAGRRDHGMTANAHHCGGHSLAWQREGEERADLCASAARRSRCKLQGLTRT